MWFIWPTWFTWLTWFIWPMWPGGRLLGPVGGFEWSCGRLEGPPRPPVGWITIGDGPVVVRWIDGSEGTLGFDPLDRLGWLARDRTLPPRDGSASELRLRSRIAPLILSGSASF